MPDYKIADRIDALVGRRGYARFASCYGVSPEHLSRMMNKSTGSPDRLIMVLELLERLPRDQWPERWRPLRDHAIRNEIKAALD